MIQLKTSDPEVFHEAEEILRFFIGMEEIRNAADEIPEARLAVLIETRLQDRKWIVVSTNCLNQHRFTGVCDIKENDKWGIKRAKGRAVKFSMFQLLKEAFPEVSAPWGCLTGIRPTKLLYEYLEYLSEVDTKTVLSDQYGVSENRIELLFQIYQMQHSLRLSLNPKRFIDLYIGIPFCPSRCDYCSFASTSIEKHGYLRNDYLYALTREAKIIAGYLRDHDLTVGTLYVGGGTPTALNDDQLAVLLDLCSCFYPESKEFTVEAGRPDTITSSKLKLLKRNNVNRISINPQSMHNDTLRLIGRNHSVEEIISSFQLARDIGFTWINMDLIAGLPGENNEMFERSIEETKKLSPENITVHTLSIKRSSNLRDHLGAEAKLKGTDVKEMVDYARNSLEKESWHPYYLYRQKYMSQNLENVGYSKPGFQSLYNINVMEETNTNIALGAGGITKWYSKEKNLIKRAPNVKNVQEYIARSEEMAYRSIKVANEVLG